MHVIPVSMAKQIEKIQRDFLWGCDEGVNRYRLVSWDVICQPRHNGGLGIRRLVTFNRALLGKLLWRFAVEGESFWRCAIMAKYGVTSCSWWSGRVVGSHGRALWKGIMLGLVEFRRWVRFKVGDGSRVRFWTDIWCGDQSLESRFPRLFGLAGNKDALVADFMERTGGGSFFGM